MASGDPHTSNLIGTKDGVNKTFTSAANLNTAAQIPTVIHASKTLKPSWHLNPGEPIDTFLRYNFTAPNTFVVGIAPAITEDLWVQGIEA